MKDGDNSDVVAFDLIKDVFVGPDGTLFRFWRADMDRLLSERLESDNDKI